MRRRRRTTTRRRRKRRRRFNSKRKQRACDRSSRTTLKGAVGVKEKKIVFMMFFHPLERGPLDEADCKKAG
jgi:hypothetical protein